MHGGGITGGGSPDVSRHVSIGAKISAGSLVPSITGRGSTNSKSRYSLRAGADPRAVDFRDGRMKGPDEVLILAAATLDGQASASLIFCVGRARARSIHEACEKYSGEALRTRHRGSAES